MGAKGKKIAASKKQTTSKKSGKAVGELVAVKSTEFNLPTTTTTFANAAQLTGVFRTQQTVETRNTETLNTQDISSESSNLGIVEATFSDDGTAQRLAAKNKSGAKDVIDPIYTPNNNGLDMTIADQDAHKDIYHSVNLFTRTEIRNNLYERTFRFGLLNPYGAISTSREYLFFTKPDLNILETDDALTVTTALQSGLCDLPFWKDLFDSRRDTTIKMLQNSIYKDDPFNHLLQNQVISNLEIPGLTAEMTDTPTNMFGVGYSYRGSSEASDDNPEFSLEFKDTRYLDTYMFFKAYEEYETLKHHGIIRPSKYYIKNKILHDQFSIYKFIVDEDMETIIYYGKMYGVSPKSLPRDVFSNPTFDSGLSYSIDFRAAFYEDMKPDILGDFNYISKTIYNKMPYKMTPYNSQLDHADMRPAGAAFVYKDKTSLTAQQSPTGYVYKLKWRGSEKV